MRKVLILDRSYQVIDIMPFRKALGKWGRSLIDSKYDVQVVSSYEDIEINVNGETINPPSILRFNHLMNLNANKRSHQSFSRRNVWLRDDKECQYCGKKLLLKDMHWDHVTPRSRGGRTTWLNMVCCCKKCNDIKADKPLNECGLKLRKKITIPLSHKTIYQNRIDRLRCKLTNIPDGNWFMFVKHILEKNVAKELSGQYENIL